MVQQKQKGKVRKQETLLFARLHGAESAKFRYIEGKVCGFMVLRRSVSKKPCSKSFSLSCSTKESAGGKR